MIIQIEMTPKGPNINLSEDDKLKASVICSQAAAMLVHQHALEEAAEGAGMQPERRVPLWVPRNN